MHPALLGHAANRRALYATNLAHFPQHDYFKQYISPIHEHRQRYIAPLVADLVWKLPRRFSLLFGIPAEINELIFKYQGKHIWERRPQEAYIILDKAIPEAMGHITHFGQRTGKDCPEYTLIGKCRNGRLLLIGFFLYYSDNASSTKVEARIKTAHFISRKELGKFVQQNRLRPYLLRPRRRIIVHMPGLTQIALRPVNPVGKGRLPS
jgi:hypothetical protein